MVSGEVTTTVPNSIMWIRHELFLCMCTTWILPLLCPTFFADSLSWLVDWTNRSLNKMCSLKPHSSKKKKKIRLLLLCYDNSSVVLKNNLISHFLEFVLQRWRSSYMYLSFFGSITWICAKFDTLREFYFEKKEEP